MTAPLITSSLSFDSLYLFYLISVHQLVIYGMLILLNCLLTPFEVIHFSFALFEIWVHFHSLCLLWASEKDMDFWPFLSLFAGQLRFCLFMHFFSSLCSFPLHFFLDVGLDCICAFFTHHLLSITGCKHIRGHVKKRNNWNAWVWLDSVT